MKKSLVLLTSLLFISSLFAQQNFPWEDSSDNLATLTAAERANLPQKYRTLRLKSATMSKILSNAPLRSEISEGKSGISLAFPMPDGANQNFEIFEESVMHPDLAAKYPSIKTYIGFGIDDATANVRFGISPKGFHAMILSGKNGTSYIDAADKNDTETYRSFFRKDYKKDAPNFTCETEAEEVILSKLNASSFAQKSGDCLLRNYRLALACTGEYAEYHGGTKTSVMAEYARAMARINGIYERDFSITMTLVPNNDDLIFLDAATDPYNNNNSNSMLSDNQTTCDDIIGNANYDIGHVFSTSDGGVANLRSVCNSGSKAQGVTGQLQPTGDLFWVEYVCHEMGHQFGANHTQNNPCNRVRDAAIEPGSGSTIMSYIGICAPNIGFQGEGDAYFHAYSMVEIYAFIQGAGDCATTTNLNNNIPTAEVAFAEKTLPVSTPFVLYGTANDLDGNATLTYGWDQMNNEIATMPPVSSNTGGPAFQFIEPTSTPERYFPNIEAIIAGQTPMWEVLPSVSRDMDFRFVVRDNTGCVGEDDVKLNFNQNAGPFLVEEPNGGEVWFVGETKTIEWDVANTVTAPVNCANVDILLSKDGGRTYPVLLAENVSNDGNYDVIIPDEAGTNIRAMIRCSDNYFFDISNQDFTIELPPEPTFIFNISNPEVSVCSDDVAVFPFSLQPLVGFNENVVLSVSGIPAPANATFQPNSFAPPGMTSLRVSNLASVPTGTYSLVVTGTSLTKTVTTDLVLNVFNGAPQSPILNFPADGAEGIPTGLDLRWADSGEATGYFFEIAESPAFGTTTVTSQTLTTNEFAVSGLANARIYFWRVTPNNICGNGVTSDIFAFRTLAPACQLPIAPVLPVAIPEAAPGNYTSTIEVTEDFSVVSTRVLVEFEHAYIGDLQAELEAPDGTRIALFERPGHPDSEFGCGENNMQVVFDDQAANSADILESTCNTSGNFGIAGEFQPLQPLANFVGKSSLGTWTLRFADNAGEDGGRLTNFQLELCQAITPPAVPNRVTNFQLSLNENTSENITQNLLEYNSPGVAPADLLYRIRRLTAEGDLRLNGTLLAPGNFFSQENINLGQLSYTHRNITSATTDDFIFDVFTDSGGWLSSQVFNINILVNSLSILANIDNQISCFGDNDGQITINGAGGVPPIEYRLNNGTYQASNVFAQLTPGDYTPTVRDANGFTQTSSVLTITQPTAINVSASVAGSDITVNASGGTGNLEYSINGTSFQSSNIFPGRDNGAYTITVKDENGCTETTQTIVAVNSLIASLSVKNQITCAGDDDGSIEVNVAGGTVPYLYSLNGGPFVTNPLFENLADNGYTVLVRDADGFEQSTNSVNILSPDPIDVFIVISGDNIIANASGGTGTLRYSIDGGDFQTNKNFASIANGDHEIVVRDDNGCTATRTATVAVNQVQITARIITDLTCFGVNNGAIEATADGGVAPYRYSINGGMLQSSGLFENLAPGCYTILTEDAEGFTKTIAGNICLNNPTEIIANANVSGYNITVNASGGNPPLEYSLNGTDWQLENLFENNMPGLYDPILVRDASGCSATTSANIDTDLLTLSGRVDVAVRCNNGFGIIVADASGGIQPYEYSIDGTTFQSSATFLNYRAGDYTLTVRDAGGFTTTADLTMTEPTRVEMVEPGEYMNQSLVVTTNGGTPGYEYNFNGAGFTTDNVLLNAEPGKSYLVQVRDANGCTDDASYRTPEVLFSAATVFEDCTGATAATIQFGANGGVDPVEYSIDNINFQTERQFDNVTPGDYTLYVRDGGGFNYTFNLPTVSQYPLILTADVFTNEVTGTTTNGAVPYQYSIDGTNFVFNNNFTNLLNGDYTLTVQDANGCDATYDFKVNVVSIDDLDFDLTFEINPNPSTGIFNLKINQVVENQLSVRIFDTAGKLVFDKEIETAGARFENQIEVQNLQAGSYLVTVFDGQKIGRKQLIIVK